MYPFELIPTVRQAYMTISYNSTPHFNVKHGHVKKNVFPSNYNRIQQPSFK